MVFQRAAESHWSTADTLAAGWSFQKFVFLPPLYVPFTALTLTLAETQRKKKKGGGCSLWPSLSHVQQGLYDATFWLLFPLPLGQPGQPAEWDAQQGGEKRGRRRRRLSPPLIHLPQISPRSVGSSLWYKLQRHKNSAADYTSSHWRAEAIVSISYPATY